MTSFHVNNFTDSIHSIGVDGISIKAGNRELITNGKLSLATGHRYGLCGRNGSGKTTLLTNIQPLIKNSILIDQYIRNDQWQEINIVDAILESNKERLESLKKYSELDDSTDVQELQEIMETLGSLDVDKDIAIVQGILKGLGFTDQQMEQNYYSFSGGWKTRVSLARGIYMKPKVLFLDEPTNHLDMEAILWLEDYLQEYKGILIFVSHNIRFLNVVSTDILHIDENNIKQYNGNYNRFKKQLELYKKKQQVDWEALQKQVKALKSKGKGKEADAILKKKSDIRRPEKPYKIVMKFESGYNAKSPYVVLDNVSFGYNSTLLLNNVNLSLDGNTKMTIVGLNGCGKSTLLKLIMGELEPKTGTILRNDNVKISYFHQHSVEELPDDLTPVEYLQEHFGLCEEEVRKVLGCISLEGAYHKKPIKILSGGQRMRIVFSSVILEQPNVILLDEPTNHLDIETTECLIESINNYNGCVVIISHDVNLIEETDCHVYHLHDTQFKLLKNGIDDYIDHLDNN
jgi:ATPase subunit of ABC transporter with duplicated ATPase domains